MNSKQGWLELAAMARYIEILRRFEIPDSFPVPQVHDFASPQALVQMGIWTVIDRSWTKKLAELIGDRRVLEVMAGGGWLAKALADNGVEVIATDSFDPAWTTSWSNRVFNIEQIEGEAAVARYSTSVEVLLIAWPPARDNAIERISKRWGSERDIIVIGQPRPRICGSREFWKNFCVTASIRNPTWPWRKDERCYIGRYTSSA